MTESINIMRIYAKKTLQKLVYLIEKQGVNLDYDFSIHYYGPYSSELNYAIYSLQMQGIIDIVTDINGIKEINII